MLRQLRQTRYLALAALMVLVATICAAAGTWQVFRLVEKHDANDRLRANAHQAAAPVGDVLATTADAGALAGAHRAQYRTVTATGTYLDDQQLLVRERTVDSSVGYLVLTPLRTAGPDAGVLLVVRGFVAADGNRVPTVGAAPSGVVTVTARVEPTEDRGDDYGRAPSGQVRYVNVASAAARLAAAGITQPVFAAYGELIGTSPGAAGLTPIPAPDLSNPAGGAVEPQHLAYVVQWYLFALLALAAPLVMARVDSRRDDESVSRSDLSALLDDRPTPDDESRTDQAARLAQRYGSARRI